MIILHAENYDIKLVWQCPECKECVTTNIHEVVEHGIPLCMIDHLRPWGNFSGIKMKIVSYLVSDKLNDILSQIKK